MPSLAEIGYVEVMAGVDSDEVLMQRVQRGDFAMFEELVRRYRQPLLRVAASKLQDLALAEDAVQDSLLAAFAARATFNARFAFRTWIWTITLRRCHLLARQRQRGRCGQIVGGSDQAESAISCEQDALAGLLKSEQAEWLQQLLAELPEVQADAIRLRFFGGLSFEDVAQAMNSSVSGAKQRVRLGLERLSLRCRALSGVEQ